FPLVAKLSRPRTDHLPHNFPGYAQLPADRFDGLALPKKCATDLCNRLHDQHPNLGFQESWKPVWTLCSGVPIGSRSPRKGGSFCMPIHIEITRPNQVWAMDITYIPMARGFVYLAVVLDWFSRRVLSWRLSITMDAAFCVETLEDA